MVLLDYRRTSSVMPVLQQLQWQTLQERRAHANVIMMYHIVSGLAEIPTSNLTVISSTRRNGFHYPMQELSATSNPFPQTPFTSGTAFPSQSSAVQPSTASSGSIELVCVSVTQAECPPYQTPHTVDAMTVCCHPVFNCGKDHEIVYCAEDGGQDKCVPCASGKMNSYITSSLDKKHYVCFIKTKSHEDCPIDDTYATIENASCENMYCRCKTEDCRYGDVCQMCKKRTIECGVNEEINAVTGDCEPCGEFMNSPAGCGPCLYNETAWRLAQEKKFGAGINTEKVTTKVSGPIVSTIQRSSVGDRSEMGNTGYIIATNTTSNNSAEGLKNDSDDGISITLVIIIIAVLLFIGIFIALILYIRKKLQTGDHNSRLVTLYNRMVPNNKYRNRQDPESTPSNGNLVAGQNTDGRQTQAVQPIVRKTEALVEGECEGATCGNGAACSDGADMQLLKDEGKQRNDVDETKQKLAVDEN